MKMPDLDSAPSLDFIRARVAEDVKANKNDGRVHTRFPPEPNGYLRSEEHTSELQSLRHLVCRLLLEKKKNTTPGPLSITGAEPTAVTGVAQITPRQRVADRPWGDGRAYDEGRIAYRVPRGDPADRRR